MPPRSTPQRKPTHGDRAYARRKGAPASAGQTVKNPPPLRVFLVEDSSLFRDRLTEHLAIPGRIEIVGYADSEASAIAALRSSGWDALILDVQLKQGNGLEVLKALQATGRPARARVIVLTIHDYYLYRRKSKDCGADYFFNKSQEFHLVTAVLEEMIGERAIAPA